MNISKQVIQRLEELAAQKPEPVMIDTALSQPGYTIQVLDDDKVNVILYIRDYDRYSAALRTMEASREDLAQEGEIAADYLQQQAEQLIQRLTYLEEPLALVELDETEAVAQVRSQPPRREEETVIYWEAEIQVRPHPRIRLSRYAWRPGQPGRELVVYPAAFSRLGQIAEALALSLAEI